MKIKSFFLLVVFLVISVSNSYAVDLSLANAVSQGLEYSDDIKIAMQQIDRVEELINEASSSNLPTLSLNANYQLASDLFLDNQPSLYNSQVNAGLEAGYLLFAFGAISDAIESIKFSKRATIVQKSIIVNEFIYAIKIAYFSSLVADGLLKVAQGSYENAVKSKSLIERQAAVRAPQADIIKISADIASRRIDVENSKINRDIAYRLLKTLINMDSKEIITLTTIFNVTQLPNLNDEMIMSSVVSDNGTEQLLELRIYDFMIESDKLIASSKRKGIYPNISLVAGYGISNGLNFGSNNSPLYTNSLTGDEGYIGVNFTFKFFDGFKSRSQSNQHIIDSYIKGYQKSLERRDIKKELEDSIERYQTFMQILKLNKEAVVLGQRSYDLSLARFLNGQTSATELNDVERSLSLLKANTIQTLNNIYSSLAVIEKYIPEVNK